MQETCGSHMEAGQQQRKLIVCLKIFVQSRFRKYFSQDSETISNKIQKIFLAGFGPQLCFHSGMRPRVGDDQALTRTRYSTCTDIQLLGFGHNSL